MVCRPGFLWSQVTGIITGSPFTLLSSSALFSFLLSSPTQLQGVYVNQGWWWWWSDCHAKWERKHTNYLVIHVRNYSARRPMKLNRLYLTITQNHEFEIKVNPNDDLMVRSIHSAAKNSTPAIQADSTIETPRNLWVKENSHSSWESTTHRRIREEIKEVYTSF